MYKARKQTHSRIAHFWQNQCYTVSTTDASGVTKYYRSHNQRRCLHRTRGVWRDTANPRQITAAAFYLWHIDKILNDFQVSLCRVQCRQTLAVAARQRSRCNRVLLTYREETKQPRHPITGLPLLEFSPVLESWSDIYTGPTFLPYHDTISTPDTSVTVRRDKIQ